ncbi:hypothetical protein IGI04_019272 [Brassica rapa subsp. trilocularis]|uniref:Uncharacterized protein n=1 Tax=Brassica rapa subsp. trilocularis TaxID=1813537 RepID=A0ABQ7MFC3_BRACM|nr:hypothetical protein IGI04_019272 [Brassica rapa subsp. trilocularis]
MCMVDTSWTSTTQFSGCVWVWKDMFGKTQLLETWNLSCRETALHSEMGYGEHASVFDIIGSEKDDAYMFPGFQDLSYHKSAEWNFRFFS